MKCHNTNKGNIRDWRQKKTLLDTMKKSTTMKSYKEIWPELESELKKWVKDQRK